MQSSRPTSPAAERLAALIDLAREHDDDLNYAEVELLLAASHRRLIIREGRWHARPAPEATRLAPPSRGGPAPDRTGPRPPRPGAPTPRESRNQKDES